MMSTRKPDCGPDPWPSCGYLLTINPDNSVTLTWDQALLDRMSLDEADPDFLDVEDILIGVQNNSGHVVYALHITGSLDNSGELFAFDDDFDYTNDGRVFFSDFILSLDPEVPDGICNPPDEPFDCIAPSGTVHFVGGLAPGGHTWFGLEGSSQIEGDPISLEVAEVTQQEAVPEPATLTLLGVGLGLGSLRLRKKPGA